MPDYGLTAHYDFYMVSESQSEINSVAQPVQKDLQNLLYKLLSPGRFHFIML